MLVLTYHIHVFYINTLHYTACTNVLYTVHMSTDDAMHLSGSMVASSFGKLVMKDDPRDGIKVGIY